MHLRLAVACGIIIHLYILFNHCVHWQCLILAGSNLPLGDKSQAAFSKAIFAKTNVVSQICFQDGWHSPQRHSLMMPWRI